MADEEIVVEEKIEEVPLPVEAPVAETEVYNPADDFNKMYNAIEDMAKNFDRRLEKLSSMVIDTGAVVKSDTIGNDVVSDTTRLEDLDFRI